MNEIIFNKKNLILLCIVVLLVGTYVIFVLFINNSRNSSSNSYLYVGNYLILQYKNGKYIQMTDVPKETQKYDFTVYDGMTKKNAEYAQYLNNTWYFLGKDYSDLNINNYRIAYTGLDDITLADYKLETYDYSDDQYIVQVNNTKNEEEMTNLKNSLLKVKVDLDNDGRDEILYTMSSYSLSVSVTGYKMMSYLFVVDDGKAHVINKSEGMNPFTIIEILDLDDDGINEFIISKGRANMPSFDECNQIYEFKDGEYELKQDCIMD